jgi:DNA polymerase-1
LGEILYDELKLKVKSGGKTASGARSTKEEVLQKMDEQHEIIKPLLKYRELQKLVSTYVDALPKLVEKDGRLHPTLLQHGTTTGRMASIDPNIQNIPVKTERGKEIRSAFVSKQGSVLVACDYSQIELRIAAMISKDKKFIDIFRNGEDVHGSVASYMFEVPQDKITKTMRNSAKAINFGVLYGMGVVALQKNLGVSRKEAKEFYENYFETFSELTKYLETIKAEVGRKGYTETMLGRRRYFKGIKSPMPHIKAQAERMAINAPIQGTSADITKIAMVRVAKYIEDNNLSKDVSMILQIHDELIFEIKKEVVDDVVPEILKIMENVIPENETAGVPVIVKAEVGPDWGNLKEK